MGEREMGERERERERERDFLESVIYNPYKGQSYVLQ